MPVSTLLMSSLIGGMGGNSKGQGFANVAGGLLSGVTGFFQRRKAKKELAKLHRPEYTIPNEILQNQKRAELAANEGLPSEQYAKGQQDIQRQQNRALLAAGNRRGALMALPGLQQQANDSLLNLNINNAQAKRDNEKVLYGMNAQLAGYKDKAFNINKLQPYQEDKNYYQSMLGAGNQNLIGGIDKLASGAGLLLGNGRKRSSSASSSATATSNPTYYNGYDQNSDYGTFETGF